MESEISTKIATANVWIKGSNSMPPVVIIRNEHIASPLKPRQKHRILIQRSLKPSNSEAHKEHNFSSEICDFSEADSLKHRLKLALPHFVNDLFVSINIEQIAHQLCVCRHLVYCTQLLFLSIFCCCCCCRCRCCCALLFFLCLLIG